MAAMLIFSQSMSLYMSENLENTCPGFNPVTSLGIITFLESFWHLVHENCSKLVIDQSINQYYIFRYMIIYMLVLHSYLNVYPRVLLQTFS